MKGLVEVAKPQTLDEMKAVYFAAKNRIKLAEQRAKRLADMEAKKASISKAEQENLDRIAYESAWAARIKAEYEKKMDGKRRDVIHLASSPIVVEEWQSIRSRVDAIRHAKKIIAWVAKRYGLTPDGVIGKTRMIPFIKARHLAIQMVAGSRKCSILSMAGIGKIFGGRDHTTILYAARKMPCFRRRRKAQSLEERGLVGANAARIP